MSTWTTMIFACSYIHSCCRILCAPCTSSTTTTTWTTAPTAISCTAFRLSTVYIIASIQPLACPCILCRAIYISYRSTRNTTIMDSSTNTINSNSTSWSRTSCSYSIIGTKACPAWRTSSSRIGRRIWTWSTRSTITVNPRESLCKAICSYSSSSTAAISTNLSCTRFNICITINFSLTKSFIYELYLLFY